MANLKMKFTDKDITAWGGAAMLQRMMDKMSFAEVLKNSPLPAQGLNRGYNPIQLITQFIVSLWCGVNRYEHLEMTRFDGVIQQMFDWKSMAGHRAFVSYFQKFSMEENAEAFSYLYRWFFSNLAFDKYDQL